jgi:hypothetical protein
MKTVIPTGKFRKGASPARASPRLWKALRRGLQRLRRLALLRNFCGLVPAGLARVLTVACCFTHAVRVCPGTGK